MYIEPSSHYLGNWSPRAGAVFLHVAVASTSKPFEGAGFGFVIHGEFAPFQGLPAAVRSLCVQPPLCGFGA